MSQLPLQNTHHPFLHYHLYHLYLLQPTTHLTHRFPGSNYMGQISECTYTKAHQLLSPNASSLVVKGLQFRLTLKQKTLLWHIAPSKAVTWGVPLMEDGIFIV